ncbi:MAG TPA: DUF418 domain-containing protein [Candidatus Paenibacillus intestinavium]|nr:DUF418 domain-containing protein [Candidatus Paenibacillus intestinavium]
MNRIETLDVLRGFALLGIIFINIYQLVQISWVTPNLNFEIHRILDIFVNHRFNVIFSFLFGVGFYMFLTNAEKKGKRPIVLYLRRASILLLIGIIHHYFQPGEVLLYYAIISLLLIPFYRTKALVDLIVGIVLIAAGSYLGFPIVILGTFLVGQWAGKIGLFQHPEKYLKGLRRTQIIALLLIIPSYYGQQFILDQTGMVDFAQFFGGLSLSIFYVMTITLIMYHERFRRWMLPLGNMGRMALSNYLMQTVLILTVTNLLQWDGNVQMITLMITATVILFAQFIASTMWLKHFNMGPVEYIWRLGTYGKARPLLKRTE